MKGKTIYVSATERLAIEDILDFVNTALEASNGPDPILLENIDIVGDFLNKLRDK